MDQTTLDLKGKESRRIIVMAPNIIVVEIASAGVAQLACQGLQKVVRETGVLVITTIMQSDVVLMVVMTESMAEAAVIGLVIQTIDVVLRLRGAIGDLEIWMFLIR